MAKRYHPGKALTQIRFWRRSAERDNAGYFSDNDGLSPLFGGELIYCQWTEAWGRELFEARQAKVTEPATLTLPYTDGVSVRDIVEKIGDSGGYFEIISVNDVGQRHEVLEVKVSRKEGAK